MYEALLSHVPSGVFWKDVPPSVSLVRQQSKNQVVVVVVVGIAHGHGNGDEEG